MEGPNAISVRGLGKHYRLGARRKTYQNLREHIAEAVTTPYRRLRAAVRGESPILTGESLWALRDVDFEIEVGEVVGVIGRNGAGKTTLLKILSRITEPTEGRAEIRGLVASLLEVGTGFHPELTGRENIYLNGAILGMPRAEITRKFDEIVAFAEVERFLDTQVKHYSSGMYLRLAFAVAAHLDPEILLIDEVLAVGDASFQRRCLGKMNEVAEGGRTVLFVSHNLAAISRLCHRCILLEKGQIVADGPTAETIQAYAALLAGEDEERDPGDGNLSLTVRDVEPSGPQGIEAGRPFRVHFDLRVRRPLHGASLRISLRDTNDRLIVHDRMEGSDTEPLARPGRHRVSVEVPGLWLAPGPYSLTAKLISDRSLGAKERCSADPWLLQVTSSALSDPTWPGIVRPVCRWAIDTESTAR